MVRNRGKQPYLPEGYLGIIKLGQGAYSVVWQVKHEGTGETFALKLATEPDPAHRLQREFAILRRLELPGIVKVAEFGEHEGCEYFTMELIPGKPFTEFMAKRRKDEGFVELFLMTLLKTTTILLELHKQGIVHIDVKPSNLLVKEDGGEEGWEEGEPVLLDFGFAEDYVLSPTAEPSGTTLDYAAPELFTGGSVSAAADIYSLGAIAFEVISGKKLWKGKSPRELIVAKLKTPPGLGKVEFDIPSGLEALILRMLNPDPGLRPSAAEVLLEISWIATGEEMDISAPAMVPRLVFGGREDEVVELSRLVFEEKRVVLLSGESGMGKTRLLRELRFKALVDEHSVLHIEGRGAHISVVDYISSTLNIKHPEIDPASQQRPDKWARYERVFQAVEKGGFAGVFIDAPVDFTDDESGLLGYLARGFDNKVGLILSQVPERLHPEAAKVVLLGLDEGKTTGLVSKTFGEMKDTERLSHTVFSLSKGNPRRMNELLDLLHTEGWLSWKRGWLYESKEDAGGLAARLEDWLGEGISRLDKNARMVLDLLAVAQSPLSEEVVGRIIGENAPLVLQELANKSYIRSFLNLNQPHFEFANDVIEPYLLDKLSTKRKKSLAARLADSLEKLCIHQSGDNPEKWNLPYLVNLAERYFQAGLEGKSSHFLLVAGKRLKSVYNYPKATVLLENALKSEPSIDQKKEILHALGDIAASLHNPKQAENYYTSILPHTKGNNKKKAEIYWEIGFAYGAVFDLKKAGVFLKKCEQFIPDSSRTLKNKLMVSCGVNALHQGNLEKAQNLLETVLGKATQKSIIASAHHGLCGLFRQMGKFETALEHAEKAFEIADAEGDKGTAFDSLLLTIHILRSIGNVSVVPSYIDKAHDYLKNMHHPTLMAELLRTESRLWYYEGQLELAIKQVRMAIDMVKRFGDKHQISALQMYEAEFVRDFGDWKSAQKIFLKSWKDFPGVIHTPLAAHILQRWANTYKGRGQFNIAERMLKKGMVLAESRNDSRKCLWLEINFGWLAIEKEEPVELRKVLTRLKPLVEAHKEMTAEKIYELQKIHALVLERNYDEAYEISSDAISWFKKSNFPPSETESRFQNIHGISLIGIGKFDEGLSYLYKSLEMAKKVKDIFQEAKYLFSIAEAIFEHKGYSEEAVSALEEAHTIFERLGAKHQLEKVKKLREEYMTDKLDKGSEQYLVKLKQVSALIKDLRAEHLSEEEGKLGLPYQYLEGLKEVSELINRRLGKENFLDELLNIVLKLTKAQRGVVFCHEDGELHPVVSEQIDDATSMDALRVSKTVIDNLRKGLDPVYTSDATADERFKGSQSILLNKIRSIMCIPLKTEDALIGTIYVDSKQTGLFDTPRITFFAAIGNLLAVSIEKSMEFKRLREDLILTRQKLSFEESGIVVGSSSAMKKLCSQLEKVASSDTNILLEGETGTGKGVFARMIHERSNRSRRELCVINCGVLPENTFESELFGTKKGAYTGATTDRIGLLEAANCSTVFFDEITNTSPQMQAKLLEVIEDKVIRRMGETRQRQVNLRFIFATNRDLAEEVAAGRFREDLYYRISALILKLPPLRKRKKDLTEFIDFFLDKFSREFNKDISTIDGHGMKILLDYPWPGNIRELRNVIERSVLLAPGSRITKDIIEQYLVPVADSAEGVERDVLDVKGLNLKQAKKKFEEKLIRQVLASHKTVEEAAQALGVSRTTLWRKMSTLGIKHHVQ